MNEDTLPVVSSDPDEQAAYERMRREGTSHNMAEILATHSAPGLKTDTEFRATIRADASVPPGHREKARRAGVNPDGKQYFKQLARFPGDPEAWQDSRSGIAEVCHKRGWGCTGKVEVKLPNHEVKDDEPIRVAEDIVAEEVKSAAEKDPGLVSTKTKRERLVEDTRERLNGTQ